MCSLSEVAEKQVPKSDQGQADPPKTDASTASQSKPLEPTHSVPTKHEDADEILVEIGNQDSDTGNSILAT